MCATTQGLETGTTGQSKGGSVCEQVIVAATTTLLNGRPHVHSQGCSGSFEASPATPETTQPCTDERRVSIRIADDVHRFARYHILGDLGFGAMGDVRLAYDPMLERKVALKTLRPTWQRKSGEPVATRLAHIERRLKREARSLAHLDHPHIVDVYDVGVHDGSLYIAMDFIRGQTLRAWSEFATESKPWREISTIMLEVGRALAAAHDKGVIHRDFKPDNVMVDRTGSAQVIDFGIALDASDPCPELDEARSFEKSAEFDTAETECDTRLTGHGNVVGTPAYMAPEQREHQNYDGRVDQFAFCVTFFELLYGQRPFEGTTTAEELEAMARPPRVPPERQKSVPRWLHRILLRGLRYCPTQRHASMHALCDAIEAGWSEHDERKARQWRWALVLTCFAGLAWSWMAWGGLIEHARICGDGASHWRGTWNDDVAAQTKGAFLGTGLNYAEETWGLLQPLVDERIDDWMDAYTEVCEATKVHGTASDEDLDVRMECLRVEKARLVTLIGAFVDADARVVEGALRAAGRVDPGGSCLDASRLRDEVPWPTNSSDRAVAAALRVRMAEIESTMQAGRYASAERLIQRIETKIQALKFDPIRAELALHKYDLDVLTGNSEHLAQNLRHAIELGQKSGHRRLVAKASTSMIFAMAYLLGNKESATSYKKAAEAAINSLEGDPRQLEATLSRYSAILVGVSGNFTSARQLFAESVDQYAESVGRKDIRYLLAVADLGTINGYLHAHDRSLHYARKALTIANNTLGKNHPRTADMNAALGVRLIQRGDVELGQRHIDRGFEICKRAANSPFQACAAYTNLAAIVARQRGRYNLANRSFARLEALERNSHRRRKIESPWSILGTAELALETGHLTRALEAANAGASRTLREHAPLPSIASHAHAVLAAAELATGITRNTRLYALEALRRTPKGSWDPTNSRLLATTVLAKTKLQTDPAAAFKELEKALQMARKLHGQNSPMLAPHYRDLAQAATATQNHPLALEHAQKALELKTILTGPKNPALTTYLAQLGRSQLAAGDVDSARASFRRGLENYDPEVLHTSRHSELEAGLELAGAD